MTWILRMAAVAMVLGLGATAATGGKAGSTYLYVHDRGIPDRILAFSMDSAGGLAAVPGSPFTGPASGGKDCGGYCETLGYSAKRKMLFSGQAGGVCAWTVAEDGSLSLVEGSPFGTAPNYGVAAVDLGKRTFVYGGLFEEGAVQGYEVQADGTLVAFEGAPTAAGAGIVGARAVKNRLLVASQGDATISSFHVNPDGSLVEGPGSPGSMGVNDGWAVDLDPRGKFAMAAEDGGNAIPAFTVNARTAALAPVEGSPFETGLPDLTGGVALSRKLAVALAGGPQARVFRVGRDGSLSALGAVQSTGGVTGSVGHAFDAKGRILALAFTGAVRTYAVDGTTGVLTLLDTASIVAPDVNDMVMVRR